MHSATAIFMGAAVVVHIAGCAAFRFSVRVNPLETPTPTPTPAKIILTTGEPWVPKKRVQKRKIEDRRASSNYKLLLQFFFERPVDINLWKRIKAPRGWRKCPTGKDQQIKYFGVRFQCREIKYALTPDEIEELRARLYMCLETVF